MHCAISKSYFQLLSYTQIQLFLSYIGRKPIMVASFWYAFENRKFNGWDSRKLFPNYGYRKMLLVIQLFSILSSRFRAEILRSTDKCLLIQIIAENFPSSSNSQETLNC